MTRRPSHPERRPGPGAGPAPLPLRHPATVASALVVAACALISVTYPIFDPDLWQHLLVGKVIWTSRSVPHTHLWSWPTLGEPEVLPSWGFRALLWPFWSLGGIGGLFAWRWLTTLATLSLAWAAARRMGGRGLAPLVVLALAARMLAARSQLRPETLIDPLLALEIWILETRRKGGRDRTLLLIPLEMVWANAHLSWFLGLAVLGAYALDEVLAARRRRATGGPRPASARGAADAPAPRSIPLAAVLALAALASLLNPFGWNGLAQPFIYAMVSRHEPLFRTIAELQPPQLPDFWKTPLGPFLLAWAVAGIRRARRSGLDVAELLVALVVVPMALQSQRFSGFLAVAGTPFLARDVDAWVRALPRPAWSAAPAARAALTSAACVALFVPAWRDLSRFGIGIAWSTYPVRACDFIESHGIRGRGFNHYDLGGYLLWRFFPDPGRLPFMDIHQSGTREDRDLYAWSGLDSAAWRVLDDRRRFEWALFRRLTEWPDHRIDFLEADNSWALVFADDGSALFARRRGPRAGLADSLAYRFAPVGAARLRGLGPRCAADPALRRGVERELGRMIAESPFNVSAHSLLATVLMMDARWSEARAELERALERDPGVGMAHARLAEIALAEGDPARALAEVARERRAARPAPGLELLAAEARDSLAAIDARAGR